MKNLIEKQRKFLTPTWMYSLACFLKIKFGGGLVDARGSIGGNTYSRNHYGAFMRARVTPVNPNTARQQIVKATITFLAARWANTLTAGQRTAWNLYGSSVAMTDVLGATMYLTGYNHYIRSNTIRKMFGEAIIDAGPTVFEIPAQDPTLAITCTEAAQTLSVAFDNAMDWATEDGAFMAHFQGKPQNAQREYFGGPWRVIGLTAGADPGPIVSPEVNPVQFAIAEGQHVWGYSRIMRADGRMSQKIRDDTFCTA